MSTLGDLIPLVNKLQDLVFNTIGTDTLDLPQVVVVGSQSSGKSSVLENIVGRDFLPRGTGIVTRRPLILQLVNIPAPGSSASHSTNNVPASTTSTNYDSSSSFEIGSGFNSVSPANGINTGIHPGSRSLAPHTRSGPVSQYEEWGEFLHIPNQRFYDFNQIRREIEHETARIAGSNKGIDRLPINLKIYSPHVLNLTLVDLPGLTKIPIGDQPTDIERQTRNLILEYIAKPNSIILAVSPANVDIVNSESLKLARQVDPQGKRTIGILTKLDLMDHGTNALDILSGNVYPLKLGFIGVVNRSQQDILGDKSLQDALAAEREFFSNHSAYRNIAHRCGTSYLAKSLNQTLMSHIRERLPDIKARLNTLMGQTEQELASYGDVNVLAAPEHRSALLLTLMTQFASSFVSSIDGTSVEISTKELCGGARIYYIYNDVFGNALNSLDPTQNLSMRDIRTAIRNSTGPRPSLFVPELAFDLLVKPQIKLLEPPSHRCVELVYEELMKICHNCGSPELSRYPKLQGKLIEVVSDLLRERLGPTSSYVSSLIAIQRAYINTNHPNFLGAASAMQEVLEERKLKESEMKQQKFIEEQKLRRLAEEHRAAEAEEAANEKKDGKDKNSKESKNIRKQSTSSVKSDSSNGTNNTSGAVPTGHVNGHSHHNSVSSVNGVSTSAHTQNGAPSNKDSFLNYFFGKDSNNGVAGDRSNGNGNQGSGFNGNNNGAANGSASGNVNGTALSGSNGASNNAQGGPLATLSADFEEALGGEETLSEREMLECELIRRLIISYFSIVRESIQDQVPKAVMHLLVNFCKESAQTRLVSKLYKESLFEELLHEDEQLAQERKKCENLLHTYKEAAKIIGEVI